MLYGGRINSMVSTGHCADVMFRVRENYCWYGRRCPRMLADKTQPLRLLSRFHRERETVPEFFLAG
jgi:hypothetical protein